MREGRRLREYLLSRRGMPIDPLRLRELTGKYGYTITTTTTIMSPLTVTTVGRTPQPLERLLLILLNIT